jgi:alpha-beta hydrolase superfamily lysophospholipase
MRKIILRMSLVTAVVLASGFLVRSVGIAEISSRTASAVTGTTQLTFTTDDGLTLYAWKSEARRNGADTTLPGLALLLPMLSMTHESYDLLIDPLHGAGYSTIAFDLRGHGMSIHAGSKIVSFRDMNEVQFAKMPGDLDAFFRDFRARHGGQYNFDDVVVIGASIGANTAGLLLGQDWVKRAVLLSPGRSYYELQPAAVMMNPDAPLDKPIYIAAAIADIYSAESGQWFFEHYAGPKVFKKYPGADHGTEILRDVKDADQELIDWVKSSK